MTADNLPRQDLESARTRAGEDRCDAEAEAEDRAYMERRIAEFVEAVGGCLGSMREHGNPGLEGFTVEKGPSPASRSHEPPMSRERLERASRLMFGLARIVPALSSNEPGKSAWRLGTPNALDFVFRALTPYGELASVSFNDGWVTAADFIPWEMALDLRVMRSQWYELNKRGTVNLIGEFPQQMGDGDGWRTRVDEVIKQRVQDLGELLHRHGIDVPHGDEPGVAAKLRIEERELEAGGLN